MAYLENKSTDTLGFIKWVGFLLLFIVPQLIYVYVFFIEPNWIQVKYVKIVSPRLSRALAGITVVHISDMHIESLGFREVSMIENINAIKPDLILVTGDLIGNREAVGILWNILSLLEPKTHTYAVCGESDSAIDDLRDARQWNATNTSLIDGKLIRLDIKGKGDTAFWLVGSPSEEGLSRVASIALSGEPVIVVNHRPDIVKQAAMKKVDLVVAGHTHGGQVGITLLQDLFPYAKRSPYIAGLYKVKDTLLYVNRGISSEKGLRFLCRPEITVYEFAPEGKMRYQVLSQDK